MCNTNKSHTQWGGDPQTGKEYHRGSPTKVKVPGPRSGSPNWRAPGLASGGGGAPWAFNFEGQRGLIVETPQDWGKQILLSEGAHSLMSTRTQRKKQWLHRSEGQTYLLGLEGFLGKQGWLYLTADKTLVAELNFKNLKSYQASFPQTMRWKINYKGKTMNNTNI